MLHDFFGLREVCKLSDGRRVSCGAPTLAAFHVFSALFIRELVAVAQALANPESAWGDGNLPEQLLPLFLEAPERAARVLDLCCTLHGGAPGELADHLASSPADLEEVARTVLGSADLKRLASLFDLSALARIDINAPAQAAPTLPNGEPIPGPLDQAIVSLAERFGCRPQDVAAWPMEMVLSLRAVDEQRSRARESADPGGRSIPLFGSAQDIAQTLGAPVTFAPAPIPRA